MYILHGTWLPDTRQGFDNRGRFYLWVETDDPSEARAAAGDHPAHLAGKPLTALLGPTLNLPATIGGDDVPLWYALPSTAAGPLPSAELLHFRGEIWPDGWEWRRWQVAARALDGPLAFLKELHFRAAGFPQEVRLGRDLLFWYRAARAVGEMVVRHHYIPALVPHAATPPRGRRKKDDGAALVFTPAWEPLAPDFGALVEQFAAAMPGVCRAAALEPDQRGAAPSLLEPRALLRHFARQGIEDRVRATAFPQRTLKAVADTLVAACLDPTAPAPLNADTWRHWRLWRDRLESSREGADAVVLGLRLHEAAEEKPDAWPLEWLAIARHDPSLQLPLADYWAQSRAERSATARRFGADIEQALLLQLGHAARIWPPLWGALEGEHPAGVVFDRDRAFAFLKEGAWVLEAAGYKVIVPAWWTPEGRVKAQLRLRAGVSAKATAAAAPGGWFSLPGLVDYRYELAIGGEPVSAAEWQALVEAKAPLVRFRGQWMELDQERMARMLEQWRKQGQEPGAMSLPELLAHAAAADEAGDLPVALDPLLEQTLLRLRDRSALAWQDNPPGLRGELRDYQRRGLSWLTYLESLGLGPCLADDMGLGKTLQVIALLLHERAAGTPVGPTLLIAPTSVLGNWHKEMERFAPQLRALIHHGPARRREAKAFREAVAGHDVVVTSFALARLDAALLAPVPWHRVVVDEAQNLKNPEAAQTKAVLKLAPRHRLALTGTPIENRLLDLWSIFRFLNPGYLGTQIQFRKRFEVPIQRDGDSARTTTLRHLVEPFILRRLKSDPAIAAELPPKIEQKVYCQLSREQASLYEAVVREVQASLEGSEGIQRQGLILSTLMRLKQICNHPAQFLQDGSPFTAERSHKLARVAEMVAEVVAEGESLLLFTQFTEVGAELERLFRRDWRIDTFYLHGGTPRTQRERMIEAFQDPAGSPAVFVLSLKAGGVGITLTRASHVFHFDRWWNPAVENQATDRAYRIGQTKRVFVHKLVTLGTLEERIDHMLEEKQRLAEGIIGNDESWLSGLDNEAFRALIALDRSAVLEE